MSCSLQEISRMWRNLNEKVKKGFSTEAAKKVNDRYKKDFDVWFRVKWRRCALNVDASVDLIILIAMRVNQ